MSAPAVPGGGLFPGEALPVEDLIAGLVAVSREDPERADGLRQSVIVDVFEHIRDGHPDPVGLAARALSVLRARFERW